jgi:hypothetical protein
MNFQKRNRFQSRKETLSFIQADLQWQIQKRTGYPFEGYFIMGEKRSWVGKIDKSKGLNETTDYQITRVPINGGVRLEPTLFSQLPRGTAIWYLSPGLYKFSLLRDASTPAEEYFGEVDEKGNLQRLTQEEMVARI